MRIFNKNSLPRLKIHKSIISLDNRNKKAYNILQNILRRVSIMKNTDGYDQFSENNVRNDEEPMGVGRWVGTLILLNIPIVNLVFFLMWFFGVGNRNRVQYIRANFIVFLIKIIIITIIVVALMGTILAFFDQIKEFINSAGSLMPLIR